MQPPYWIRQWAVAIKSALGAYYPRQRNAADSDRQGDRRCVPNRCGPQVCGAMHGRGNTRSQQPLGSGTAIPIVLDGELGWYASRRLITSWPWVQVPDRPRNRPDGCIQLRDRCILPYRTRRATDICASVTGPSSLPEDRRPRIHPTGRLLHRGPRCGRFCRKP